MFLAEVIESCGREWTWCKAKPE